MYVCICQGITEEDLTRVGQTASTPKEVLSKLGVGDGCGICLIDAIEKLDLQAKSKSSSPQNQTRQKSV